MANVLTDALATETLEAYYTTLQAQMPWYSRVMRVIDNDTPNVTEPDLSGITTYASQVASPTPVDITAGKSTTASVARELVLKFTEKEVRDVPNLLQNSAEMLARRARDTLDSLAHTAISTLDTTAHPEAGSQYAAGAKFCDDFTTGAGDPVTQSNLGTTALSASSLSAALTVARGYLDKSGVKFDWGSVPDDLCLIVPPDLETTAMDLLSGKMGGSPEIYNGAGLESRSFGARIGDIVVMPEAADANDWFLWNKAISPLVMWIRQAPTLRVTPSPGTGHVFLYASFEGVVHYRPFEGGVFMASVA
jgi:hypothetical protein